MFAGQVVFLIQAVNKSGKSCVIRALSFDRFPSLSDEPVSEISPVYAVSSEDIVKDISVPPQAVSSKIKARVKTENFFIVPFSVIFKK